MNRLIELLVGADRTRTENGAAAHMSTGADCLDLFSSVGALRSNDEEDIYTRFIRAYAEDPDMAVKILFYARDVRGGLGERRIFRVILRRMAFDHPESVRKNIGYIFEYGRYDDLMVLMGTPCEDEAASYIARQLTADVTALENGGEVSLLAKWLPSVNASSAETVQTARRLAKHLGMSERQYRKVLVSLRQRIHIIENDLRTGDYSFDYEKQCSRAMYKYRKAFIRNDGERYKAYLEDAAKGIRTMHTSNIYPYEIVEGVLGRNLAGRNMADLSADEVNALNTMWENLPVYGGGNALAVVDTSGSMYCGKPKPASVALSLGIYLADKNKGAFGGCFMEFSDKPTLIKLKGSTFAEKLRYAASFSRVANTNIEAVFELILRTAVINRVRSSELPETLILISDMEFDSISSHADRTVFEHAKSRYEHHGYALPRIVFWNVQSRNAHQPVRMDERGVILVSGCTPKTFEMVASGETSPYEFMLKTLSAERYSRITA